MRHNEDRRVRCSCRDSDARALMAAAVMWMGVLTGGGGGGCAGGVGGGGGLWCQAACPTESGRVGMVM